MELEDPPMPCHPIGESCLCWPLGEESDPETSRRVLAAFRALRALQIENRLNVLDVVPSYGALAVYFDPLAIRPTELQASVETAIRSAAPNAVAGREVTLPMNYDGPDLDRVAAQAGLSRAEAIALHSGARYTVAMIGFLPHFPYLVGLPAPLATPRLDPPRRHVPAGSVTLAENRIGIYPQDSSGAWNIIGSTDPLRLEPLEPGDTVVFAIAPTST